MMSWRAIYSFEYARSSRLLTKRLYKLKQTLHYGNKADYGNALRDSGSSPIVTPRKKETPKPRAALARTNSSPMPPDHGVEKWVFPKRVQLGLNRVGWVEREVLDWLEQRLALRE